MGDSHEIEFIDWTGATTRRIQWTGPDLEVTPGHIDLYRENLYEWYEERQQPDWQRRFEELWAQRRPALPNRFPAHNTIMAVGGLIWVKYFRQPGATEHQWLAFDMGGNQVATMLLPAPECGSSSM